MTPLHRAIARAIWPANPKARPATPAACQHAMTCGFAVAVNPATDTIYAVNVFGRDVSVVDGHTNKVTATVKLGGEPLRAAADPKTDTIYVTNAGTVQAFPRAAGIVIAFGASSIAAFYFLIFALR
jgi:YVTN family beta-propeller protein